MDFSISANVPSFQIRSRFEDVDVATVNRFLLAVKQNETSSP
jgi:hypothetical protein